MKKVFVFLSLFLILSLCAEVAAVKAPAAAQAKSETVSAVPAKKETAPAVPVKKEAPKAKGRRVIGPHQVTPVEKYVAPALAWQDSWMMVVVPDTQGYVKNNRNHGIADIMFTWISENVDALKIQQVLIAGDLVDQNRSTNIRPTNNTCTGYQQWQAISRAVSRLDGVVPYIPCTGNHDYGWNSAQDRGTYFNEFFHPGRNTKWSNILRECGPNSFGQHTLENAVYEFVTPNGQKIVIISVAFAPTDAQLAWARNLFNTKYKDHFGILLTHAYLNGRNNNCSRITKKSYIIERRKGGNVGDDIFKKLVSKCPNLRMVICGHMSKWMDWDGCVGYSKSVNESGKSVHEILFDPQALGGGWSGSGGDGWIRLMEFSKDMKQVKVRTFSPLFAISPATRHLAWHTQPYNDFVINID